MHTNLLAVLLSAVAAMVIGGIWYGPLFGKVWMEGMGWDPNNKETTDKMKKAAGPLYFQQFIGSLLTAFVLSYIIWAAIGAGWANAGISAGISVGFWVWLGFILPIKYADKLWAGKKMKYLSVDLGCQLVTLILMGVILTLVK